MEKVVAKLERKLPVVVKKTKDGSDFKTQKIVIVWDETSEYPSRLVLEQGWDKRIELLENLVEGQTYEFYLTYRVNYWTGTDGVETAFGSVSAWKYEEVDGSNNTAKDELPF